MTLRLKINLIVGALMLLYLAGVIGLQLRGLRDSVHEEVVAANRVAAQLLDRTAWRYAAQGTPAMLGFLQGMGRIRANDVVLRDAAGQELYRSPPSPYKAGRDAPAWFSALVAPAPSQRAIDFPDGRLEVHANASRAVLDAWDELLWLAGTGLATLLAVTALVFWGVGRALQPLGRIVSALQAVRDGRLDERLPPLPGREASAMAEAFNRMTTQLSEQIDAERRASRAEAQLHDSQALTRWIEQHIEQERKLIARELHDELGQSVTAVRSMALSIAQRHAGSPGRDADTEQAARLIADEAGRLYDAMHGIIPRLAPPVLDALGLAEALDDLVARTRRSQPGLVIDHRLRLDGVPLLPDAALTLYRAAQEGITNALRHGQARRIDLAIERQPQPGGDTLRLTVVDDGGGPAAGADAGATPEAAAARSGTPTATAAAARAATTLATPLTTPSATPSPGPAPAPRGHHGLRWLAERAQALGGSVQLQVQATAGARLEMTLPLAQATAASGPGG